MVALLIARVEPVPAPGGVGRLGLRRIGDEERLLLGEIVHPRAGREVVGRLGAAVQHHHEGQRLSVVAAWNVELVRAASRRIGVAALVEPRAVRQRSARGPPGRGIRRARADRIAHRSRSRAAPRASAAGQPRRRRAGGRHPMAGSTPLPGEGGTMSMIAVPEPAPRAGRRAPASAPRRTAIASSRRPSRVRRVASIMSIFDRAFMNVDPCVARIPARRERCPSSRKGSEIRRPALRAARKSTVSACGRAAPPSLRDWLAGRRAREWRRWCRGRVRQRRPAR